jgi:hypothetical protein
MRMKTLKKDAIQTPAPIDDDEAPTIRTRELEGSTAEGEIVRDGAAGAVIGGLIGGGGGAILGGLLGLTRGASRDGAKKKRSSWY